MKKIILLLFFSISSSAFAQKEIICADGVCSPNFNPTDQFEKIYHSGIDVGTDNEDDLLIKSSGNQAPRSARIYVENKPGHIKNATVNLTSGSEFHNAADGMLIGNMFNNISMILNGYSGISGKSASQICAERYQLGGSLGYGDIARAEFQAKRIDNPSLPMNRCVYSDVEYLQNNSFSCDEEEFNPIDSLNPSVTVRRHRGKNKCLGVSFNDVCLQKTVEVTCNWKLQFLEPASFPDQNSMFYNWGRFSNGNFYVNRAAATDEAAGFQLISGKITNPTNSTTVIGFVSPEILDYYTAEGEMTSSNKDDDSIGVVAAFKRVGSKNYMLSVSRTASNAGWLVQYNAGQSDGFSIINKAVGQNYSNASNLNGWSGKTAKFKIQRDRDILRFWVSDWNGNSVLESSLIEIDLNSNSKFEVFKNGSSYGWLTSSQASSSVVFSSFSGNAITGYSSRPEEYISKRFLMSEGEYNLKKAKGLTSYLCNNLAKSEEEEPEAELVSNSGFNRNSDNWTLSGNAYWVNSKLKLYSGPVLNDPSDDVGGVKKIPQVGNPISQSFTGNPITVYLNFIPKSPVVNPNPSNITFIYKRSGFNCDLNMNECTFTHPADGVYYSDLLLATVKIEDSNGYKSYYDIKSDIGFGYDQTTAYVGGYGKKMRCSGGTASNSTIFKYTINENDTHCANGMCFPNSQAIRAVQVWHPTASSILVWHRLSGDWRRKCGGNYIYSVGYHFFLRHYPRVRVIKKVNVEGWTASSARQVIRTQSGRTYRLTAFLKSALEELRKVNGIVNVYEGTSAISSNLITSIKVGENGLRYPLTNTQLTPIDFTFKAESSSILVELVQDQLEYSAYFDDISIKRVSLNAGPPVKNTDPPVANVIGLDGLAGQYALFGNPVAIRTRPGYDVENIKTLPDSSWKIIYTTIGGECPAYSDKIQKNYLASAVTYDENDNACDDVSIPEDPQGIISWRNVGFERKVDFGTEELACSPSNCPIDFTIEDRPRVLNVIDTSNGISGTQQGQGIVFIYDAQSIQTQAKVGIPGYAGANDLPNLADTRMCARIKDSINSSSESPFSSNPTVEFRRYNWKALEVKGSDVQPKIPENNGKRVYIFKKLDSSLRHLLKQELL